MRWPPTAPPPLARAAGAAPGAGSGGRLRKHLDFGRPVADFVALEGYWFHLSAVTWPCRELDARSSGLT